MDRWGFSSDFPQATSQQPLAVPPSSPSSWSDNVRRWVHNARGENTPPPSLSPISSSSSFFRDLDNAPSIPPLMSVAVPIPAYDPWTLNGRLRVPKVSSAKARFYYTPGLTGRTGRWALEPKPHAHPKPNSSPTMPAFASRPRPKFHTTGTKASGPTTIRVQPSRTIRDKPSRTKPSHAPGYVSSPNNQHLPHDQSYIRDRAMRSSRSLNSQSRPYTKRP